MTATTSANKSFFGRRFITDLASNRRLLIINIVLELLGLPVITGAALALMKISELEEANPTLDYDELYLLIIPFIMLGTVTIIVGILLGIVIALFHYDYLYRKSIVDMNYSLPLSTTQRFFADYLSGLCIYMIPAVCASILSLIIYATGSMFIDTSQISEILPNLIMMVVAELVGMVMLYTVSILSIVFCGSTFEAIYSVLAVNVMIPSVIACLWFAVISASSYGMVFENIVTSPLFTATSPIGVAAFILEFMSNSPRDTINGEMMQYYNSMFIRWIIVTVIMTVIYLAAAFLLNHFRKAESVSKPYVYKAFFYMIFGASVFCIMSLFISNGITSIPAVIMCAVGWFIMEVITRRGFKKFWTAPIGFIATVIGVYMICGFCNITNGFGASRRVPSAVSVESVNIGITNDAILPYDIEEVSFRDKDVIKSVIALNKEAVDRHFNFDNYSYDYIDFDEREDGYDNSTTINISYHTFYGTSTQRRYDVPSYMLADIIKGVLTSDEYASYAQSEIAYNLVNYAHEYSNADESENSNRPLRCTILNKLHQEALTKSFTRKEIDSISKAYEEDLKNMTESDLMEGNVYCYIGDYWVLDSFENTKEALGVDIAPIDITAIDNTSTYSSGFSISKYPTIYYDVRETFEQKEDLEHQPFSVLRNHYYYDYDSNDNERFAKLDTLVSIFPTSNYYYNGYDYESETPVRANKYLEKLIETAKPIVIGEKPIAMIRSNGYQLYIIDTKENRELIKKYYNS
ncbi:MAG: hypothetical protein J6P14_06740 [Ruminococcus sp.]|nr:hypothetical protein [Ruminococcus sp.]